MLRAASSQVKRKRARAPLRRPLIEGHCAPAIQAGFDETNISTFQSPTNFARIAYRTSSAVDETPSLRIAEAR